MIRLATSMRASPAPRRHDARVCIIGGGGSGAALAWDLSLRGLSVTLLEKGEFTSGTTGRHHGQLHCGARYAVKDRDIARECMEESLILRRIVPEAIEYNGGIFVAISDADADYADDFLAACHEAGIPAREVAVTEALAWEPAVNPRAKRAVWVPDGSFDAWRVPASFLAGAASLGADLRNFTEVMSVEIAGGRAVGVEARGADGNDEAMRFDYVVNAGGAWAGKIGALAGLDIPITPAPGAMVAVKARLADMVVSRLAPPGDGDIIVPQRGLSIIGSTQRLAAEPEGLLPTADEISFLLGRADELMPGFSRAPFHAAWAAARPLAGVAGSDAAGRAITRDFAVLKHAADGVRFMATIMGGKATVLRAMAEKAADAVCADLGIESRCRTRETALPSWREMNGSRPSGGKAAR